MPHGQGDTRDLASLGNRFRDAVHSIRLGIEVPHYSVVSPGRLSRSGQPDRAGFRWLRLQGVRSVINLRETSEDADELRALGFTDYLHLPIPRGQPPSDSQVGPLLEFISQCGNWPVHVHCLLGASRTGTVIALIRLVFFDWSLERALKEANSYFPGPTNDQAAWLRQVAAEKKSQYQRYEQSFRDTCEGGGPEK